MYERPENESAFARKFWATSNAVRQRRFESGHFGDERQWRAIATETAV